MIVGHYTGCGWPIEQIFEHLHAFPYGIGEKYIGEGRLSLEISRSFRKWRDLPSLSPDALKEWTTEWMVATGFEAKASTPSPQPDPELDDDIPEPPLRDNDPETDEDDEVDDDLVDDEADDSDDPEPPKQNLPRMYAHGDSDPRPIKSWAIKHLMPACGHGLLSGQWGAGKTFIVFELAAALGSGQPFLGHIVKRQSGVLLIAAEGASEVRLRLDAVIRAKCGGVERAPFRWYETTPALLQKGSIETLVAMAKQAEASLLEEFGLPLGLIVIDTIAACAGYARSGDENDPATGSAVMNVLKALAEALGCFVLGVDHFGKNLEAGTRGASSKEASGDLVLACLGDKQLSGSVTNTRLAVRKNRGGRQGQEYPFTLQAVNAPEPDEDGEPIGTMVVNWTAVPPGGAHEQPDDPWSKGRKQEQRTAALRLKRVLMTILADQGVELAIPPDGPVVRMVAQKIVQREFYAHTPADGTPEQKRKIKHQQFSRALAWAEDKQLIGVEEVEEVTYLRLTRPDPEDDDQQPEPE
jgi:AAA domain